MIISAKNLAKYFRDTVSFDFKKETISSYTQIRRRYDDFYALENTQAFSALLKDVIGHNDQLMDVFIDLNAAGCGFECFAEKANQDEKYRDSLRFCGSHSGRDCDKFTETGLTYEFDEDTPIIEQAKLIVECRKLYADDIKKNNFIISDPLVNYKDGDYHRFYICEIEKVLVRE